MPKVRQKLVFIVLVGMQYIAILMLGTFCHLRYSQ